MTTQPDDGGPVYPTTEANYQQDYCGTGISLRDLCAIEAMKGLVIRDGLDLTNADIDGCYILADAMLVARGKR